jgi:hypothetical protein
MRKKHCTAMFYTTLAQRTKRGRPAAVRALTRMRRRRTSGPGLSRHLTQANLAAWSSTPIILDFRLRWQDASLLPLATPLNHGFSELSHHEGSLESHLHLCKGLQDTSTPGTAPIQTTAMQSIAVLELDHAPKRLRSK